MKKILFLSFSVLLFSCGGGNRNEAKQNESSTTSQTENQTKSESKSTEVETPMSGTIKEVKKTEHGLDVLVTVECIVDEKLTPNLFYTKLQDDDGLECGVELVGSSEPRFSFKDLYKGDKSSGWLSFKFPNSNYIPKKVVFSKIGGGKLCEIPVSEK